MVLPWFPSRSTPATAQLLNCSRPSAQTSVTAQRQPGHNPGGMSRDPLQDIDQPSVGSNAVQAPPTPPLSSGTSSCVIPMRSASRDAQRGSYRWARRGLETDREATSMVACVVDGLEQRILRWTRHARNHGIAPSSTGLGDRPGMIPTACARPGQAIARRHRGITASRLR